MMGNSRNGHSFVLVGPDGQISWRADYGGAPDYTVTATPVSNVVHTTPAAYKRYIIKRIMNI